MLGRSGRLPSTKNWYVVVPWRSSGRMPRSVGMRSTLKMRFFSPSTWRPKRLSAWATNSLTSRWHHSLFTKLALMMGSRVAVLARRLTILRSKSSLLRISQSRHTRASEVDADLLHQVVVKLGNPALALATDHVIVAVRVTDEDIGVESLPIVLELVAVHPILHAQDAAVSRRRSTPPTMHSRHFAINAFFRLIRRRCGNQRLT